MSSHVIPGGTAEFREESELTERHRRMIMRAGTKMPERAISAATLRVDGEVVAGEAVDDTTLTAAVFDMSEDDLVGIWGFGDAHILAHLKSWTIDLPLPACDDDLLELPGDLYDALQAAVAKVVKAGKGPDGFGPDSAPVPDSPTGA